MKNLFYFLAISICVFSSCTAENNRIIRVQKKVLLLSHADAMQTPIGQKTLEYLTDLQAIGQFSLDTSLTFELLDEDTLQTYSALLLFDLQEDDLEVWHHAEIERYVQAGGGILVMDSLKITPYLWHWYEKLLNGNWLVEEAGKAELEPFQHFEIGYYHGGNAARKNLAELNLEAPSFKEELNRTLEFLIGDNSYDYTKATHPRAPKSNRFKKVILDDNIFEPMEMVILPSTKVLFLERRGKMKLHDPFEKRTLTIAEFDVCIDGNYEDGLQGIALDPNYGKSNHWIYVYYSPSTNCEIPEQYLSRFEFSDDTLHWSSEKVVLKVPVQRETCCHSGGSVEFGPDGLLYLSTGDNTSSKESDGFTPTDERPSRAPFDAQKSSSNTQDLRGKILRIRPEADGTYSIPEGNLFSKDGSQGRPEIYAMGCRNPFRMTIDQATNWLYWGDVGPDGGVDGRYGPQSYDEWNQAKSAGNFGWPYFVGDNKAYPDRNFETDEVGLPQDPLQPINDSPNNTGAQNLPPAQPAWIWYPYGKSKEFPLLGEGSRSSLAGPFYYQDGLLPLSNVKFPKYYEGKFFIYEWTRSWIKVLTIDKTSGNLLKMESFLPDMPLSKPIELEFGPDGALYILEYGNQYFMNNPDAMLSRIEFSEGNRAPIPKINLNKSAGAAPHRVHFSAAESFDYDLEDSLLTFEWFFTTSTQVQATGAVVDFVFEQPGIYHPVLKITDSHGDSSKIETKVQVGNAIPIVSLNYEGNQSFYFDENNTAYRVEISDSEDTENGGIDVSRALVNASFVESTAYLNQLASGTAELPEGPLKYVEGFRQIQNSDCLSCHHETEKNIGPAYFEVAQRYKGDYKVVPELARKIIRGGGGVWGDKLMAGHPQLRQSEAEEMIKYILSLESVEKLPLQGNFQLNAHLNNPTEGGYILSAAYKDRGANGIESMTGRAVHILRNPKIEAENTDEIGNGFANRFGVDLEFTQVHLKAGGYLRFNQIDLKNIRAITFRLIQEATGKIEVRLGQPTGKMIASTNIKPQQGKLDWEAHTIKINPIEGVHDLYFVFGGTAAFWQDKTGKSHAKDLWHIDWLWFKN